MRGEALQITSSSAPVPLAAGCNDRSTGYGVLFVQCHMARLRLGHRGLAALQYLILPTL